MKTKDIILVGGGGHCRSVIDVAECAGFNIIGILDLPSEVGNRVLGYPIIGTDAEIPKYIDKVQFVVTVGQIRSNVTRKRLFDFIKKSGGTMATVISPDAYISKHSKIGEGTVIMHKAFVNANCNVGENSIINTMVNIEHDVIIGSHTHISTGAMVNGGCIIGNDVFIGSQAVISNQVKICEHAIIGAGCFVHKNISKPIIYINRLRLKQLSNE